jgi:hypothetical protein
MKVFTIRCWVLSPFLVAGAIAQERTAEPQHLPEKARSALAAFDRTQALNPALPQMDLIAGLCDAELDAKLKQFDNALTAGEELVRRYPRDVEALNNV